MEIFTFSQSLRNLTISDLLHHRASPGFENSASPLKENPLIVSPFDQALCSFLILLPVITQIDHLSPFWVLAQIVTIL